MSAQSIETIRNFMLAIEEENDLLKSGDLTPQVGRAITSNRRLQLRAAEVGFRMRQALRLKGEEVPLLARAEEKKESATATV
jgi:hypothetical protein